MQENLTFLLPTVAGKQQFGWAAQTVYTHIFRGDFPFPLYLIGRAKMMKVSYIQSVIDTLKPVQNTLEIQSKRRLGRPTKAAQITAADLKSGGQNLISGGL